MQILSKMRRVKSRNLIKPTKVIKIGKNTKGKK